MDKLQFSVHIQAPVPFVFDKMLGLSDRSTYEAWTALFNPTSTYEGSWTKDSKMLFIGTDDKGQQGGMVSRIVDCVPNQFVSIQHKGLVKGNEEIMEGPEVEKWANGFENYSFIEHQGTTMVTVDLDTTEDFLAYMNDTYPKALEKLKEICESGTPST